MTDGSAAVGRRQSPEGPAIPREGAAMIKQADDSYRPVELEKRVQDFWRRAKVYEKTVAARAKGEDYYFVDGPPYTTGSIHLGQVLNKTVKDAVLRWLRMRGFHVRDQPGYDMHGLPIEVQVEKTLGITNKKEIEQLGIERFVTTCREFSLDLLRKMNVQFQGLGVWMDWDRPYMTIRNEYIEAAWWTFKRAHERGLLYEALRSLQWCDRCETALADAEVEYADEPDPSVYVRFPLTGRPDESLLIWTTTPWTLPANMAIAVHPTFTYAKVKVARDGTTEHLWIMESAVPAVMGLAGLTDYEVVETRTGEQLTGLAYAHPLASKVPFQQAVSGKWVHKVLPSDFVQAEHTGLVHTAPGHGPEDFDLGQKHGLPPFSPVDERGRFTAEAGPYAGVRVKQANARILEDLKALGALFVDGTIVHSVGHCWRCRTPTLFRATVQWFLKINEVKETMVNEVRRVAWYPDWAGSARQLGWTQNLRDWCLSRQRYWGIPLPIWRCPTCQAWTVVGSGAELVGAKGYTPGMDLHRPWIDGVALGCQNCGAEMARIKDVLDVWFDSGVASWASLGYPADDVDFRRWWPMDWIVEGPDQTRGWFNSQLAAGVVAFDRAPYDAVMMHGWVNGPDGRQMHKSLGNVIEPNAVIDKYGVDALRFYMLSVNAPWEDITFQEEGVRTAQRTLNILWNVLRFATTYMALDRFDPASDGVEATASHVRPEDRWLLSRIEGLKATVDREMASYSLHRAFRAVESFVLDDLSRWYVRLVRDRTWTDTPDRAKTAAYAVLHEALLTTAALLAPATPHLAEAIYQHLDGRRLSVHMLDWPRAEASRADASLERAMAVVQDVVEAVAKERQKRGRKLRWPVRLVAVKGATDEVAKALGNLRHVVLAQVNAKDLILLKDGEDFPEVRLAMKPNLGAIGKAYHALRPKIAKVLEARPAEEVRKAIRSGGYHVGIDGQTVTIDASMVAFERTMPEDVAVLETAHGEVVVDLRLTPDLRGEGYAREVIRRVQQMRKDMDLDVDDYVATRIKAGKDVAVAVEALHDVIVRETRSKSLAVVGGSVDAEHVVEWSDIDGQTVTIGITPLRIGEALRAFTRIEGISATKAMALAEAGYRTLAALRAATKQELSAVDGLDASDVRRIAEGLASSAVAERPCAVCDATVPEGMSTCPRCGEPVAEPAGGVAPSAGAGPASASVPAQALLRPASTYLVKEEQSEEAYRLFAEAVKGGRKGLCVTRMFPQKVRERYGLTDVGVVWLSNVGKDDAIRPKDLETLSLAIERFLATDRGVILLDGVEYLVTNNNFITVLRLLQSLRDQVAIHGSSLLFSVNPSTLDTHQLTLLEREVDAIIDASRPVSGASGDRVS
ncbi:MAG: isoleucine--tRNA ligase [Methanobacteriota archaeon]